MTQDVDGCLGVESFMWRRVVRLRLYKIAAKVLKRARS